MQHKVIVENLGKKYFHFPASRPRTLGETLKRGRRSLTPEGEFWGLRDVSFKIPAGRMLGIIGGNGAGKSTLLRLIGGIGLPHEGRVIVKGRIGGFFNLQVGFCPDLTGRENVYISGVIAGLTRREIGQKLDSIVEFAEMEDFIDMPVRTYSTGMQMRLAFSVAVHSEPEVLLIDEVLAVGDIGFQQKCLERIRQFKLQGRAICVASHNMYQVQHYCDEVLWLQDGRISHHGQPEAVVKAYVEAMT